MDATYAESGTKVVLAFNNTEQYPSFVAMFILRKTIVVGTYPGHYTAQVTIDNGRYGWPIKDMILVDDIDLLTPAQRERIR